LRGVNGDRAAVADTGAANRGAMERAETIKVVFSVRR
jgi:hypothetical protein